MRNTHQESLALQHRLQPVFREYHCAVGKCMLQGLPDHLRSSERQTSVGVQTAENMLVLPVTLLMIFKSGCVLEGSGAWTPTPCIISACCISAVKVHISHKAKVVTRLS